MVGVLTALIYASSKHICANDKREGTYSVGLRLPGVLSLPYLHMRRHIVVIRCWCTFLLDYIDTTVHQDSRPNQKAEVGICVSKAEIKGRMDGEGERNLTFIRTLRVHSLSRALCRFFYPTYSVSIECTTRRQEDRVPVAALAIIYRY